MAEFINTIDVLGDDAVIDSIIEKTITEFRDDVITTVGMYAFYYCTALTDVDLPNVTHVDKMSFSNCSALARLNMPNLVTTANEPFAHCTALKSVSFPRLKTCESSLLRGCTNLETVDVPELDAIPDFFVYQAKNSLKSVSCHAATSIGGYAFAQCTALTTVDAPCVNSIANNAFEGCSNLAAVILRYDGVCALKNVNAFGNSAVSNGSAYVYAPRAHLDSYKAATNWNTYESQFRALEDYTVDGTITGELDETKI